MPDRRKRRLRYTRDASLLCANAFSWAEQAPLLSAHAREGLLRGGAALEDAGFY